MKALTVGQRIAAGFALAIAITLGLGLISIYEFKLVGDESKLTLNHTLPAIKESTDVERQAFECILNQERYVAYREERFHAQKKTSIAAYFAALDHVDKVAREFNDQQLAERSAAVRQIGQRWSDLYEEGVRNFVENDKLAAVLEEKGATVVSLAESYLGQVEKGDDDTLLVARITSTALSTRLLEKSYMLTPKPEIFQRMIANIGELDRLYEDLRQVSDNDRERQMIATAKVATAEYLKAAEAWVKNDQRIRTTILPEMNKIGAEVVQTAQAAENDAWRVSGAAVEIVNRATQNVIYILLGAVLVIVPLSYFIARGISRALHSVARTLDESSHQVGSAAGQVSASSQTLAEGSSEQAASLEETSSSLEELTSMTRRNAESASSAKALSSETRLAAETGNAGMTEMQQAMEAIKASSNDIAKIIKSIDEIAFQTNILALNAAVEAARAGEAGAGFAVVAEEVRALAQRSAQSAKETAGKIEVAIRNGDQGALVSEKVAQSLAVIVEKARKVDALVAEIATASQEQTQGIVQINGAVSQMDKVTQSNASGAEETAAAAEELNAQAAMLKEAVTSLQALVGGRTESASPAPNPAHRQPVSPARARHDPAPHTTALRPSLAHTPAAHAENQTHFIDA